MINLIRPEPSPFPDPLRVEATMTFLRAKLASGERLRSDDFKDHWKAPEVRRRLCEMQAFKCAYCEVHLRPNHQTDVDHFRPKAEVHGETDHPGYWWLAYAWSNLLGACQSCNRSHKKTHFPIDGVRALDPGQPLSDERPLLIDPAGAEPIESFEWTVESVDSSLCLVYAKANDRRQEESFARYGLNEEEKPKERGDVYRYLMRIIARRAEMPPDTFRALFEPELYPDRNFLNLRRWIAVTYAPDAWRMFLENPLPREQPILAAPAAWDLV